MGQWSKFVQVVVPREVSYKRISYTVLTLSSYCLICCKLDAIKVQIVLPNFQFGKPEHLTNVHSPGKPWHSGALDTPGEKKRGAMTPKSWWMLKKSLLCPGTEQLLNKVLKHYITTLGIPHLSSTETVHTLHSNHVAVTTSKWL